MISNRLKCTIHFRMSLKGVNLYNNRVKDKLYLNSTGSIFSTSKLHFKQTINSLTRKILKSDYQINDNYCILFKLSI